MNNSRFAAKTLAAATALLLCAFLVDCEAVASALEVIESRPGADSGGQYVADATNALIQLEGIAVKGRAPKTGNSGTSSARPGRTRTATAATPAMTSFPGTSPTRPSSPAPTTA